MSTETMNELVRTVAQAVADLSALVASLPQQVDTKLATLRDGVAETVHTMTTQMEELRVNSAKLHANIAATTEGLRESIEEINKRIIDDNRLNDVSKRLGEVAIGLEDLTSKVGTHEKAISYQAEAVKTITQQFSTATQEMHEQVSEIKIGYGTVRELVDVLGTQTSEQIKSVAASVTGVAESLTLTQRKCAEEANIITESIANMGEAVGTVRREMEATNQAVSNVTDAVREHAEATAKSLEMTQAELRLVDERHTTTLRDEIGQVRKEVEATVADVRKDFDTAVVTFGEFTAKAGEEFTSLREKQGATEKRLAAVGEELAVQQKTTTERFGTVADSLDSVEKMIEAAKVHTAKDFASVREQHETIVQTIDKIGESVSIHRTNDAKSLEQVRVEIREVADSVAAVRQDVANVSEQFTGLHEKQLATEKRLDTFGEQFTSQQCEVAQRFENIYSDVRNVNEAVAKVTLHVGEVEESIEMLDSTIRQVDMSCKELNKELSTYTAGEAERAKNLVEQAHLDTESQVVKLSKVTVARFAEFEERIEGNAQMFDRAVAALTENTVMDITSVAERIAEVAARTDKVDEAVQAVQSSVAEIGQKYDGSYEAWSKLLTAAEHKIADVEIATGEAVEAVDGRLSQVAEQVATAHKQMDETVQQLGKRFATLEESTASTVTDAVERIAAIRVHLEKTDAVIGAVDDRLDNVHKTVFQALSLNVNTINESISGQEQRFNNTVAELQATLGSHINEVHDQAEEAAKQLLATMDERFKALPAPFNEDELRAELKAWLGDQFIERVEQHIREAMPPAAPAPAAPAAPTPASDPMSVSLPPEVHVNTPPRKNARVKHKRDPKTGLIEESTISYSDDDHQTGDNKE